MIDRDLLRNLGWSDELIDAAVSISSEISAPQSTPVDTVDAIEPIVGGSSIELPNGPPAGVNVLRVE
ncbi:MAG TPA: hypothetical protein VN947_20090 [Polyangia bacterium]|nr:hypothetical protein [Polyangia bacterium]